MNENISISSASKATGRETERPHYALVFRTHFWDEFTQRQFDRACSQAASADMYVLVDETRGQVEGIRAERVFGVTDPQILDAGFVAAGEGSIQWFSGDVPLYMFFHRFPNYTYYIQMEYDVNFHTDIDLLVERLDRDKVDVLALTKGENLTDWPWLDTCLDVYELAEVEKRLICISAFSQRALASLSQKRLQHAQQFIRGDIKSWPFCEAFIPTESIRQGFKVAELSDYGDVAAYDWWPPYLESNLSTMREHSFVHPVLDAKRYVPSLFKLPLGTRQFLLPSSWLHRKLRELGTLGYVRAILGPEFKNALRKALRMLRDKSAIRLNTNGR